MFTPLLATKLYIPAPRAGAVPRARLIERLNETLCSGDDFKRKLTLVSASAGFGKTMLISEWVAGCARPIAWLSLDEGDNDPQRFLAYLIAALQTALKSQPVGHPVGEAAMSALQSPQPPLADSILTILLNDLTAIPDQVVLVLDDYHVIDSAPIDAALSFLLDHLPPQMHLVIATREDPQLPLARLRARDQLTEIRADDLRFTPGEAAEFLNQVMGLALSTEAVAALETRTEGWIAGLQLAALSIQGGADAASFIRSFTGSHRYVVDYLVEEVLHRQPEPIQVFLLRTSILDRLCGPLCDAVTDGAAGSGQAALESLEQANLFLIPLDDERRWYRYHHLFAEVLRQRLAQDGDQTAAALHARASRWYEDNGFELEAFYHAAAANDVARAARLIEGVEGPLYFRGAARRVLNWLASLSPAAFEAEPSLWVIDAWVLTVTGQQIDSVEGKLRAAEAALDAAEPDARTRDLSGQIATIRALLAGPQAQLDVMLAQSERALDLLSVENLPARTMATWVRGLAYQYRGERAAARRVYDDAVAISRKSGNTMVTIAALTSLGQIQEAETQLYLAQQSYRRVLELVGDPPWSMACEALLGLARLHYQWNDFPCAEEYARLGLELGRQIENIDTPVACGALLARLRRGQGDLDGAVALLAEAEAFARQRNFLNQLPLVAAERVQILLGQGNTSAAARVAEDYELPLSRARIALAQGEYAAASGILDIVRRDAGAKGWWDDLLQAAVLEAVVQRARGEVDPARQQLEDALVMATPGGFIRLFVDEGPPMLRLLADASARGVMPDYTRKLLAAFEAEPDGASQTVSQPLAEPLSERELEILRLVASGLSNREISERLFLAMSTVKGHNRNIFDKLNVKRRTEAVARAQELGLL
ncbi:MAG TPA: LuxR C-terminal-related transcriptional regulator [Aggregatilinea sp.]|uniref:LuxR C-terminal-related transcriptional regulator n=1 Tax=Aggregatilinea sp. TaxID=2806333 RepID=UPI002CE28B88|nr:LuxR C-terminal-related transcriptional regulator [Aggregatilinea sp.]HML23495.1 LuxR C-terminal-related transcriptional regulator [Aggregatilinea sp.]